MVKLNLGSYTVMFQHGWINIDVEPLSLYAALHGYNFMAHDLRLGLPFHDGSVDYIYSSHMLEHVSYAQGKELLAHCYRALKPAGVMRVAVPDLQLMAMAYLADNKESFDADSEAARTMPFVAQKFWHILTDNHKAAYDKEVLGETANSLGFKAEQVAFGQSVHTVFKEETKDLFPQISLYMELTK